MRGKTRPAISLLRRYQVRDVAFLAGSGISVSSGLPTAFGIGGALVDFLAGNRSQARLLRQLLTRRPSAVGPRFAIRFERLLQVTRETVDRKLNILRCLELSKTPTFLHNFLAIMLARGAPVFTTNFDCLIERAFLLLNQKSGLRVIDREFADGKMGASAFSRIRPAKRRRSRVHVLYKLHGSLRSFGPRNGVHRLGRDSTHTVNATLDRIGQASRTSQLEWNKERVFHRVLASRILIVIGYSGLDDFDIVPALERAAHNGSLKAVIWILHSRSDKVRVARWRASRLVRARLPSTLVTAVCSNHIPSFIVRGKTTSVVRWLFAHFPALQNLQVNSVPAVHVTSKFLMSQRPYNTISLVERRFAAGRLLESAGDFDMADVVYRKAMRAPIRQTNRNSLRARGLIFSRRGYIAWLRGRNEHALASMNRGLVLLKRARDKRGIAALTNQIGLVFMSRGELDRALNQFKTALLIHRRLRDRVSTAKSLANVGIVYRRRGDSISAEKYAKQALALSEATRDRDGIARDLGNLANAFLAQNRIKTALKYNTFSFEMAKKIGNRQVMAVQVGNIGICYRRLNRFPEAIKAHRLALRLNREIGRAEGVHDAIAEIGCVRLAEKRYGLAVRELSRAIALGRKRRDVEGVAEDLDARGDAYAIWGKRSAARRDWKHSRRLFLKLQNVDRAQVLEQKLSG